MKIVVIIPTYNEKDAIKEAIPTLRRVFETIKDADMHILVTDANSPDGTADTVRELIKESSNIHLIVEKEKRGLGAAYRDAMDYAFNVMKADAIITFDADLSHDATVIPKFVEHFQDGANYVCGTRYRAGGGIPLHWCGPE